MGEHLMRDPDRARPFGEPLSCDECEREMGMFEAMRVTYWLGPARELAKPTYTWEKRTQRVCPGTYCPGCTQAVHGRYQDIVDLEVY
jgi:hypothetical protein